MRPDIRVTPEVFTRPTDGNFRRRLDAITRGMPEVLAELKTATHPRLRYPFQIVAHSGAERFDGIPVNPSAYQTSSFRLATAPVTGEDPTFDSAYFGYNISGDFRKIGVLSYMQMGEADAIEEIGFGSDLVRDYFRHHLLGRDLSEHDRGRIREVQKTTFDYLRTHPAAKAKLKEFAVSRGWPEGLDDIGHLAYFHDRVTPLREFAQEKGFTDEEMYLAGWYDLSFSNSGKPTYSVRDSDVIRIPYFTQEGEIEVWRTRNLRPSRATTHKYTSWPLDRSINREFTVEEKLYNSWRLDEVRDQTVVITEGEFKCLVATEVGKVLTVGVPGITEVDDMMIKKLVSARARNYVVILDRDPEGKGIMRVDGITDSERAAYKIAKQLQTAGASNVRVGIIPNVRDGEKVGLDDLILDKGKEAFDTVIRTATSPDAYAERIGLNTTFFALMESRQRMRKAIEHYENSVRRGGAEVSPDTYLTALRMRDALNTVYEEYLATKFRGSRRINQPATEHSVLYRQRIRNADKKIAITENGESISLDNFTDDLVFFRFSPADMPNRYKSVMDANLQLPFSMRELDDAFRGRRVSAVIHELADKGAKILGRKANEEDIYKPRDVHEFGIAVLTGYLSQKFPADEYTFLPNVTFYVKRTDHWEEHVQLPLTIVKKSSGQVVSFAALTTWEKGKDPNYSQIANGRVFNLTRSVLRRNEELYAQDKFRRVTETIWPYWQERNYVETMELAASVGISEEIAERYGLVAFSPADYSELMDHFYHRRLLSQAVNAGLFIADEHGGFGPRFTGPILVLPVFDADQKITGLRIIPFTLADHLPPAFGPDVKLVRHVDGAGRHLIEVFDPERQLYMQDRLSNVEGNNLVITYHELDGLLLGEHKREVVSFNSSFVLDQTVVEKIVASKPAGITIVLSGGIPRSRYDAFSFDGIPGYIKEIYDLQEQLNSARSTEQPLISLSVTAITAPLTHFATRTGLQGDQVDAVMQNAIPLNAFLKDHKFNAQTHGIVSKFMAISAKLMDYLEISALPDILEARPIDWYVRESKRLYSALQGYARSAHGIDIPSVEEYFQRQFRLVEPVALEELVRQRQEEGKVFLHRPLYSAHKQRHVRGEIPYIDEFENQFATVILGQGRDAAGEITNTLRTFRKSTADIPVPVLEEADRVALVQINPKGQYNEYMQLDPQRFPRVEPVEEVVEGGFRYSVIFTVDGQEVIASAVASRKKDAETLLYKQIMEQLEARSMTPQKPQVIFRVENPKGSVLEFLARNGAADIVPELIPVETGQGFAFEVKFMHNGTEYRGYGQGANKKIAEARAYEQIFGQLPQTEVSIAAPIPAGENPLRAVVEKALTMEPGDKNYIGRIVFLQQTTKTGQPKWDSQPVKTIEGETRWVTTVTFKFGGVVYTSDPVEAESKQESRQLAALNLLGHISTAFNGEE